jgi:hypothetical protein
MKGYKVFNPDWKCRGFQFEVGKTYEENGQPHCCNNGFHFCLKASDCFKYYNFDSRNKVAEVEALGEIDTHDEDSKCCTNKIHIIRELTWYEVLDLVNLGKDCTGFCNTGNRNTGDWNTGDWNTGDWNTGDWNTGDWNTGDWNTGDWNTGDWNTGDCNTGDWNTGDWNTGDWNNTNFSAGCFNTEEPKIIMFDKPSEWTIRDWWNSDARCLMNRIPKNVVEWIYSENMTDEEKAAHPEHETTGGYLKVLDEKDCGQMWWNNLSDREKDIIKALPNFDPDKFFKCTGIKI